MKNQNKIYTTEFKGIKYLCNTDTGVASPIGYGETISLEKLLKDMSKVTSSNEFKSNYIEIDNLEVDGLDILTHSEVSYSVEDNNIREYVIIALDEDKDIVILKQNMDTGTVKQSIGLSNSLLFYTEIMGNTDEILKAIGFESDGSYLWYRDDIVTDLSATYSFFKRVQTELKPIRKSNLNLRDLVSNQLSLKKLADINS